MNKSFNLKNLLLIACAAFVLTACSSKEEQEYNKPAIYWYNKMLREQQPVAGFAETLACSVFQAMLFKVKNW